MTIGSCFLRFGRKKKNANKEITLAIFGIDNAGKTTTTKCIRGDNLEVCPTMGFDLIEFSLDSYNVSMYDIGGSSNLRSIWNNYFSEIHGLVYVVDSCDVDRLDETRATLAGLLQNELIQGKPVLLLANKQDSVEAMDEAEIVSSLRLSELACANRCPCRLERSVANIGTGSKMDAGIKVGLRWLLQFISLNWADLDARVRRDKTAKAAADAEEAIARKERVRKRREERERQEAEEAAKAAVAEAAEVEAEAEAATESGATKSRRSRRARKEDDENRDDDEKKAELGDPAKSPSKSSARNKSKEKRDRTSGKAEKQQEDEEAQPPPDAYSPSRRHSRRRQEPEDTRETDKDKGLGVVEDDEFEGRLPRRRRQMPPRQIGDEDGDNANDSANVGQRRESARRHRRGGSRDDSDDREEGTSSAAAGGANSASVDEEKAARAVRKKSAGKTGRRHRRLAPFDDGDDSAAAATSAASPDVEGDGDGEARRNSRSSTKGRSTPAGLFEAGGGGKLSRLRPLRGGQPNASEDGDYET